MSKIATCMISSVCGARGKESAYQCRKRKRCEFDPCIRKIPWRRDWQPTPEFLPGESMDRESLWATVRGVAKSQIWVAIPFSRGSSTQGLNSGILNCRHILYCLSHRGSPHIHMHSFLQQTIIEYFVWIQFSHSVMSDSLWPHGLQQARPPCKTLYLKELASWFALNFALHLS